MRASLAYFLHSGCERCHSILERSVDILLSGDLVPHLDALIEDDLVSLCDFI